MDGDLSSVQFDLKAREEELLEALIERHFFSSATYFAIHRLVYARASRSDRPGCQSRRLHPSFHGLHS